VIALVENGNGVIPAGGSQGQVVFGLSTENTGPDGENIDNHRFDTRRSDNLHQMCSRVQKSTARCDSCHDRAHDESLNRTLTVLREMKWVLSYVWKVS
jgi:hypothetical protein